VQKDFQISWSNGDVSRVSISSDEHGRGIARINGRRDALLSISDYRTAAAMETELRYIARKSGAKISPE
jgi:hypothetical protein